MIQHIRERLSIILIALLPLHAFLVTVGTRFIAGPDLPPLRQLALWKELVLLIILVLAAVELVRAHIKRTDGRAEIFKLDMADWMIVLLLLLGFFVSGVQQVSLKYFIYGVRYDFVPLIAFVVVRRVAWSDWFTASLRKVIAGIGGVVAGFGLISYALPESFFMALGYSDLHSLYLPGKPIAAFQKIGGTDLRRMQSTMSGPNHLGLWLLVPISLFLIDMVHRHSPATSVGKRLVSLFRSEKGKQFVPVVFILLLLSAVFLSFSRAAWIATAAIVTIAFFRHFKRQRVYKLLLRYGAIAVLIVATASLMSPQILLRTLSNRDHLLKPLEAVRTIAAHPMGLGLGTAGPASNRVSDPCVHLPHGANFSWAKDRPELCVFVGDVQVQPQGRLCICPVLPENWYLQMGVELGIAGLIAFIALIFFVLRSLWQTEDQSIGEVAFLAFLGVSIAAMVLHAWEDSAVAYTLWIMAAVALQRKRMRHA